MDDFCFPDRLTCAAEALSGGFDYMCSPLVIIDDDYLVRGIRGAGFGGYPKTFPHATLCGRADLLRAIGYPGYRRAQDQTMVLSLANRYRGHYCKAPLYIYHEGANAASKTHFGARFTP